MFGLNKIKEAQKKAEEMQSELAQMEFTGESLNGMAKVTVNGQREVQSLHINESAFKVRPQQEVETMIVQAVNEALRHVDQAQKEILSKSLPNIPGLNL